MYILLKTDNPEVIKITNKGKKAHYLCAKDLFEAKNYLTELNDTNDFNYWSKYYLKDNYECCKEFISYLRSQVLDTNKLSKNEIKELCWEYLEYIPIEPKTTPEIIINNNVDIDITKGFKTNSFYEQWAKLEYIVDNYTQTKNNIYSWDTVDKEINPVKDLNLKLPLNRIGQIYRYSACGALNMRFYKLMYYVDYLDIHISDRKLRDFWKFYKKTMDIYALQYDIDKNQILVIPKPDEIFIKDDITHCTYDTIEHYCDGIKVPFWLYDSDKEDLDPNDFSKIKNADARTIFIKKAGIEKFIEIGKMVDTWENYPDNEWWAKSEYKLIDMSEFLIKEILVDHLKREIRHENYKYAPFLYMKNQTTGEYHIEGVSPDCKDLYDALKMRYDLLDLSEYKIEDIK